MHSLRASCFLFVCFFHFCNASPGLGFCVSQRAFCVSRSHAWKSGSLFSTAICVSGDPVFISLRGTPLTLCELCTDRARGSKTTCCSSDDLLL